MQYEQIYNNYNQKNISGRHITVETIESVLQHLSSDFSLSIAGNSVLGKPIHALKFGHGKIKIYIWSQMHGDESTCTKAILDFINVLINHSEISNFIKNTYTLCILPMVNPDGAALHTREN
ncbi:MAG TPA: peptidase M14, partial [Flavobacterium sp.]|nr:peptidase M14 [Flavobacterium sp.]